MKVKLSFYLGTFYGMTMRINTPWKTEEIGGVVILESFAFAAVSAPLPYLSPPRPCGDPG
jgi:hypothetical protein